MVSFTAAERVSSQSKLTLEDIVLDGNFMRKPAPQWSSAGATCSTSAPPARRPMTVARYPSPTTWPAHHECVPSKHLDYLGTARALFPVTLLRQ